MARLIRYGGAHRWLWAAIDAVIVAASVYAGALLRFDFGIDEAFVDGVMVLAGSAALANVIFGLALGPYAVGHMRGSFEEVVDIGRTVLLWSVPLFVLALSGLIPAVPRSLPLIAGALATLGMFGIRFLVRTARSRPGAPLQGSETRVIVFGAGEGGRQLVRALVRDPDAGYHPTALLDDDTRKKRLRIDGVRVRGTRADLSEIAEQTSSTALAVAVPSADSELLSDLQARAKRANLDLLVLPSAGELLGQRPAAADLRSLDVTDLLGRRPISLDRTTIAACIQGKTVLVTGAGGSIGSELCRQISRFGPTKLYLLDRDESALHATQISVTGRGLLDDDTAVLADIRDSARIHEVMQQTRPDIIFHAAALKHLPLLERYPEEAWKTNVLGTLNVLAASQAVGVHTFVNVSTDKAADPTCVLGHSKRVTERLTASFAARDDNIYVSVRFGNVLGSRGSVITAFTTQIEQGGPVTVTHPDVERYFMLIPEACQLVLQSAAIGRDGEVMVLEMGSPVKIDDVARTLIAMSGRRDVEIAYTGLRPGEKMSEALFTPGESVRSTDHSLVSSVDVPPLDADVVLAASLSSPAEVAEWMRRAAVPGEDVVPVVHAEQTTSS